MGLQRHDMLNRAAVPELGKIEISYPTPNKRDLVIIERAPLSPKKYVQLPYHSPHEDYDQNGLFLVWQGKVKAENNQIVPLRIYANDLAVNEDWYNASIKYSGDIRTFPVYVRSYIQLREDYDPAAQASKLDRAMRLQVVTEGVYAGTPTVTITPVGPGVAPTAAAIMNPGKTKVIALELLTPGSGLVANPTVSFAGGGQVTPATALCEVQDTDVYLVKEETTKLDAEDAHMASLFIKVHRVYESLPGPIQVWDKYDTNDRGAVERKTRSVKSIDVTGAGISTEVASYSRSGSYPDRIVTMQWFEPRGESAMVLTQSIETWVEVVKDDKQVFDGLGGAITHRTEREDEPGDEEPESGLMVVSSEQETVHPHAQKTITKKFDPSSATPVLELLTGGRGYDGTGGPPSVTFNAGTCGVAPTASAVLGYPLSVVLVLDEGEDYQSPPAVEVSNGGGGGGFALAILGFGVDRVLIENGGTYTVAPNAVFGGDGSGATGNVVLGYGVYFATVTDPGGRAKAVLTSDNTNVANNDTVTVGNKTYTFKTTLTPTEGQVLRGASADASLLNLIRAINHTGTPGTDYSCAAANVYVLAEASVTAHAITVIARQPGTDANSMATTETSAHLSWGGAVMSGGFAYTQYPQAVFSGDGNGASGVIIFGHPVLSIAVDDQGEDYSTEPDVNVLVGNGDGLVARARLGFGIGAIGVFSSGGAYTSQPDVLIGPPEPGGVQATADAVISHGVASVDIDDGGTDYATPPTPDFSAGDGTGAAGTAILGFGIDSAVIDTVGEYSSFPAVGITGGAGTGGVLDLRLGVLNIAAIAAAGGGYNVDDILDLIGGTHTVVGQLRVTSVDPGSLTTETFAYVSDGDANGAFYRYGTNFGLISWENPITAGRIVGFFTNHGGGAEADAYADRADGAAPYTTNTAGTYAMFDFGDGNSIAVDTISIRQIGPGNLAARAIRNFKVQGSNDVASNDDTGAGAATWDDIDIRVADTTMSDVVSGSWGTYVANQSNTTKYRHIRVLQNGVNAEGSNYFNMTEFEFYGELDYISAPGAITGASVETAGNYSALPGGPVAVAGNTPVTSTLPFAADGDPGILDFIGTGFGALAWANPHVAGNVTIGAFNSSNAADLGGGSLAGPVNHDNTDDNRTNNAPGSYWRADFGADKTVAVSYYSFRARPAGSGDASNVANWKLQGSPDGTTWTDLDTQTGVTYAVDNEWKSYPVTGAAAYRYLRILHQGNVTGSNDFFFLSEWEFYGDLTHQSTGAGATFDLTWKAVELNVTTPGLYETTPTITIGAGLSTATAHAVLAATGSVKRVVMTADGDHYVTDGFAVTFSGGGGTGASGTANLGAGFLDGFVITEPGRGYVDNPPVTLTGGGGSGGVGIATLLTVGGVFRIDILLGGVFEDPPPTLFLSGGYGTGATLGAVLLNEAVNHVHRLHVLHSGAGFETPPDISFLYPDGTVPPDLAAESTLLSSGSIKRVEMTAAGIRYTAATVAFTGGTGSGGLGIAILKTAGSVRSVQIIRGGLYRTVPDVAFVAAEGSGASGTASLDTFNGSVVDLLLLTPGTCTVAPNVVFGGSPTVAATALYHLGTEEWPPNPGYHTDETYGIVVDFIKQVKRTGIAHPGRQANCLGTFIDANPYDQWKTLYISSKVDLSTLPCPEIFPLSHPVHLLPRLLSVEVYWTISVSKLVSALLDSATVRVSSGANGDILVRSDGGYHGNKVGYGIREWFFGPPPLSYKDAYPIFDVRGASGSVVLTGTDSETSESLQVAKLDDHGRTIAGGGQTVQDRFQSQPRALDIHDHIVNFFQVISTDDNGPQFQQAVGGVDTLVNHYSQAVSAFAESGDGGTTPPSSPVSAAIDALGTKSTLKVSIPSSTPFILPASGTMVLWDIVFERCKFDIWNAVRIYAPMP